MDYKPEKICNIQVLTDRETGAIMYDPAFKPDCDWVQKQINSYKGPSSITPEDGFKPIACITNINDIKYPGNTAINLFPEICPKHTLEYRAIPQNSADIPDTERPIRVIYVKATKRT